MPPLTDPAAMIVIATSAVFTAAFIVFSIKRVVSLRNFRNSLKPGDYCRIEIGNQYYRAKFIRFDNPFYIFIELNTRKIFICLKSNIYEP